MKRTITLLILLFLGKPLPSETLPQRTILDSRVRTLVFNENQVYKITAYYGYQIDVELADNEEIRTVAAGDTVGWQIVAAGKHLFIKPMAANARTNLSLITSKRTYLFDLVAEAPSQRADMTYLIRFKYSSGSVIQRSSRGPLTNDPASFNFNYKIKGARTIRPTRVFDDGQFTFFQFDKPRNRDLPAFFNINSDGSESLVNYRMEGNYVVVERVGDKFILRGGDEKATVTNRMRPETVPDPNLLGIEGN